MAKSYYGYVKRDVENQIDWASITKEMVTTLEEEQGRREKKKDRCQIMIQWLQS